MSEKDFDRQKLKSELVNLTVKMLKIVEAPETNYEDLMSALAQRGQVIEQLRMLPSGMKPEVAGEKELANELLCLDSKLKQKFEEKYQESREAMAVLRQRKASQDLYRKKGIFVEGLFLDNKR